MTVAHGAMRATTTRNLILSAAERLFAERGMFAVSNRRVSQAAGQGNNAAVGYHFGAKSDLVREIERRHRAPIERVREQMIADLPEPAGLCDWVACLVLPLTEHLATLGNPTWYARFAAQVMADPTYRGILVEGALGSASLVQVIDGIGSCLPALPAKVRQVRNVMARNLLMHTCADYERALAAGDSASINWAQAGTGLVDAIVGLWLAPVTPMQQVSS